MKKLAILVVVAALSACSDSSEGQAPADAGTSGKSVVAAPAENTTTPKTDALPSAENTAASSDASTQPAGDTSATAAADPALAARRAELGPQFAAARDAFRQARTRLTEKEEELKNAVAMNSPDVDRIRKESDDLKAAFDDAQKKFAPIYEEWVALSEQIAAQRTVQ
jgi:hypothetical protein